MGCPKKLSLVDIPWPISILKCNRCLEEMRPGERLVVTLTDDETRENLVMLLRATADCEFDVSDCPQGYLFNIKKRPASQA